MLEINSLMPGTDMLEICTAKNLLKPLKICSFSATFLLVQVLMGYLQKIHWIFIVVLIIILIIIVI